MDPKERFHDNPNMVITDVRQNLHWLPKDSYGDLGKWTHWQDALAYKQTMNGVYAGGFCDWRFPTKEEALGLYDEEFSLMDWEDEIVHIHSAFVPKCSAVIWVDETDENGQGLQLNLRDGTTSFRDKLESENYAVRLVRNIR